MFLGHERCKMSVKYAMCRSLEAYSFASGQNHFVSQTKTLSSFHRFIKSVLFIIKTSKGKKKKTTWQKWMLWIVAPFNIKKKKQKPKTIWLIFLDTLTQKVKFNDWESVSSWANVRRQVYPPSLVTVLRRRAVMHRLLLAPSVPLYCWASANLRGFESFTF